MTDIELGPRPSSRDELAGWYREALEVQSASGLGVSAFAKAIGMTPATLYVWKRRLAASSDSEAAPSAYTAHTGLLQVDLVRTSDRDHEPSMFTVELCGERRRVISVPRGFEAAELKRVVATLESC